MIPALRQGSRKIGWSCGAAYATALYVTNSCTVKAYATCFDYLDSAVATQSIEKVWGIGDTLGAPDQVFSTGGDLPFVRVTDNTAPLGESMKSGAITHGQQSTLSTTVMGPGTISFQWKTSCEKDPDDLYEWDHAEFWVDGVLVAQLDGQSAWQTETQTVSGDDSHTLLWKYVKDDVESEGENCCWVADYNWASAYTATQTTEVPVPYIWLRGFFPHTPDEYDAFESAAKETAANGVNKVWECYVAGLVPTNAMDVFRAVISMENGNPIIGWTPDLNEGGTKQERVYTIEGRSSLTEGDWEELRIENGELRIGREASLFPLPYAPAAMRRTSSGMARSKQTPYQWSSDVALIDSQTMSAASEAASCMPKPRMRAPAKTEA